MTTLRNKLLFALFLTFFSFIVSSQNLKKSIAGAAFSPLDGGSANFFNGCFVNRLLNGAGSDGSLYTGVDIPVGATITGLTAYFFDMALQNDTRPMLIFRKKNGFSNVVNLAIAQTEVNVGDFPGYYEQFADLDSDYIVQENDFFDLIFVSGNSTVVNAYYICGVEIFYQLDIQ